MAKKYLTLVENYLRRFERGGFLVGDVFKFNDDFKSTDQYKQLGQNTKDMIEDMLATGLHVRVVGINDINGQRYPGNPQTSSTDVQLSLALDNGGGRYTHYVTLSPQLGQPETYYPNLLPVPDAVKRKNNVNIKPKDLEKQDHISNKSDRGDGKLTDTELELPTTNTSLPAQSATPSPAITSYTHQYLGDLVKA